MELKFLLIAAASVMLSSCVISEKADKERGKSVAKTVNVADFTDVAVSGSFDVHFMQGDKTSVQVKGKEKDVENTEITSNDGTLRIRMKSGQKNFFSFSSFTSGGIDVYITSPNLRGVKVAGSGDFTAKGKIDTDKMNIRISGSGDVELQDLICDDTSIKISGSGGIKINRINTANATMRISGSGSVFMDNVKIGHAESKISGSGSIVLKGDVKSHKENVSGSGSIKIK